MARVAGLLPADIGPAAADSAAKPSGLTGPKGLTARMDHWAGGVAGSGVMIGTRPAMR